MKTGKVQQTLAGCVEISGKGLRSGEMGRVQLWRELAGRGMYFSFGSQSIPASIDGSNSTDKSVEVPNSDGSAGEWVQAIEETGLKVASDRDGGTHDKVAQPLNEPMLVFRKDACVAAFPSPSLQVTCGIDFAQASAIGRRWFSSGPLNKACFTKEIASSRTFCLFEEVEKMPSAGLIKKGRSIENAIVCSSSKGWLKPPLRFSDEPCRHKVLGVIGDISLFGACGSQGLLVAHIVAYKAGHALHADFVRLTVTSWLKSYMCLDQ
uniref:UDP-3-O-acyl-N-acetylglucosamine deacetylase n=1 Tax=Kalanchoe fedtschenkoi TaxID=63787 RepID=A0A7N0TFY5_KALFE